MKNAITLTIDLDSLSADKMREVLQSHGNYRMPVTLPPLTGIITSAEVTRAIDEQLSADGMYEQYTDTGVRHITLGGNFSGV